ncbi:Xylose isomerase-like TIM barrel [uncultured archaeon]|nr:Xylose isomerase-like TIM barrel [uncultured archaeon]
MDLSLGVKAYYTDVGKALELSRSIELHETYDSITGDGLMRQIAALGVFADNSIDSLSIHVPIYKPGGDFDLHDKGDDGIVQRTVSIGDEMMKYVPQVLYVFHAEGRKLRFSGANDKRDSIGRLAEKANSLVDDGRLVTIENTGHWTGAQTFAGLTDFPALFEFTEGDTGMTLDICHLFMHYVEKGYAELDDFVRSYGDKIFNLHIADVRFSDPVKSEGTQIGEGNIDFDRVFDSLSAVKGGRRVMLIPEIRDGYMNDYAGFKTAIKRLNQRV